VVGSVGADSCFLIDFLKGKEFAVTLMKENAKRLYVSELVIHEFLCGNLKKEFEETFLNAIEAFSNIDFDRSAAVESSRIFREGKKKGKTIPREDCMIAGNYLANGIKKIITRNGKHFKNIKELEVISY
jgi:predicted nucleic acid-binding protein